MKIIDLLNKIANGEEVPKKIRYKYIKFNFDDDGIYNKKIIEKLLFECNYNLNDEVEILEGEIIEEPYVEVCGSWFTKSEYDKIFLEEEKKIPEKIIPTSLKGIDNLDEKIEIAHIDTISVIETVNQVLDYLKSKGDE